MMKRTLFLLFVYMICVSAIAQSSDEAVYGTELTYEIVNYNGKPFTPWMRLCQDAKTKEYYHLSNYEDYSDSCLVFYLGTLDNVKVLYKQINDYIIKGDSTLNVTINDAKNRKFRLFAPEEKRLGTLVRIQEDGSDKWGIISKNHIRNFSRVFPDE